MQSAIAALGQKGYALIEGRNTYVKMSKKLVLYKSTKKCFVKIYFVPNIL